MIVLAALRLVDDVAVSSYTEDARLFGEHVRHGGEWRFGLFVARWVERGTAGRPPKVIDSNESIKKVSQREFAEVAGVPQPTVARYLKAWDYAATQGYVPSSTAIDPGEDIGIDGLTVDQWTDCYRAANNPKPEPAENDPEDNNEDETEEDEDHNPNDLEPADVRVNFFKKFSRIIEVTQYKPETVVKLLGDSEDDYKHIETQIMIVAQWLNEVQEERMARSGN